MKTFSKRSFIASAFAAATVGLVPRRTQAATTANRGLYSLTPDEAAAHVQPANLAYPPLDVRRYGAKLDATWDGNAVTGTDDSAAFRQAISVAAISGREITFSGSTRLLNVELRPGVSIRGIENPTIYVAATAPTDAAFVATGTAGTPVPLTANARLGDSVVRIADTSGLQVGSWVLLATEEYVFSTSGRKQQLARVVAVTSDSVRLEKELIDDFEVSHAASLAAFIAPVHDFAVTDLRIQIAKGANGGGIFLRHACNFRIHDVEIIGAAALPGIRCTACAFGDIAGNTIRACQNTASGGSSGLAVDIIESSHHIKVHHNILMEYTEVEFGMRVRYCEFSNNTCSAMADTAVNTHGNSNSHIVIADNTISNSKARGIAVGYSANRTFDSDVTISGNTIARCGGKAISVASQHDRPHQHIRLLNNRISGVKLDAVQTTEAIFCQYVDDLQIRGNTVDGAGSAAPPDAAIAILDCRSVLADHNLIRNFNKGYGFELVNVSDYELAFNELHNNQNHMLTRDSAGASSIHDNVADTGAISVDCSTKVRCTGNSWDKRAVR